VRATLRIGTLFLLLCLWLWCQRQSQYLSRLASRIIAPADSTMNTGGMNASAIHHLANAPNQYQRFICEPALTLVLLVCIVHSRGHSDHLLVLLHNLTQSAAN
jgi:hypothetical protein